MKQLKSLEDLECETIDQIKFYDDDDNNTCLAIKLENETFILFNVIKGYDCHDIDVVTELSNREKLEWGIVTQKEYDKEQARMEEVQQQWVVDREMRELERLQEKYGKT